MDRVLIVGYVWPEPCSSAAGARMLGLIDCLLAQGCSVTFATPAVATGHQVDLRARGVDSKSIVLNCDSFDGFVAQLQPDLVVFDRFMMEEQFGWRVARACPQAMRVLDSEDLHSLRHARQQCLKALLHDSAGVVPNRRLKDNDRALAEYMAAPAETLFQWMTGEGIALREIAAIFRCDLTLIISEVERSLLVEQFGVPAVNLHYCPLMYRAGTGESRDFDSRAHFVSIGNFRHGPNWDAVLWLKQGLWPAIRAQLPQAELHIYGAYPPPKATALNNARQGFLVKGWAADAHSVLAQARVCLAPLRFGAGIKGKLADAMRAGTPSVTTPIGAEAMAGPFDWPGKVGSDTKSLVAGAVELYSAKPQWFDAQARGHEILASRFSEELHRSALIQKLRQARADLEVNRRRNFTGAMLQHHSHQSTHYMSRWIEAKNRLQVGVSE